MRTKPPTALERCRVLRGPIGSPAGVMYGAFVIPQKSGPDLNVIAHDGVAEPAERNPGLMGWEHVSVSTPYRTPTWEEMCRVKELFWDDTETVVQFHPPKASYVNNH